MQRCSQPSQLYFSAGFLLFVTLPEPICLPQAPYQQNIMIAEGQEKRLVESYKATNSKLRKQLQNLNIEVDNVLAAKINRIGLKKLPNVDKNIDKTSDVKFLQLEVDNQRKRLDQLSRDNENLKVRMAVDHMARAKQLEDELAAKKIEKEALKKQAFWMNKHSKKLNTTDLPEEELKIYDKLEQLNQEVIRAKKIQADLSHQMLLKNDNEVKKESLVREVKDHHQEAISKAEKILKSRVEMPATHRGSADEEEWKNLKKQFLELKESKIWEEKSWNEQNDRLRAEIRELELRVKQKKYTIENIRSLQIRRKERNYSTIDNSSGVKNENARYRNRNNSYKYNNTKG